MSTCAHTSSPALTTLEWRLLQPHDLQSMYALHLCSIQGMAVHMVKPESRDFLDSLLQGRARVIGAWQAHTLVAYGVLQHDLGAGDDPRALLALKQETPLFKLAGAAVAPAWRGQGLQRQLIARRMALAGPDAALFATAAPDNQASWRSLLSCGFAVRALQYRYGGHARYLLARVPETSSLSGAPQPMGQRALQEVSLSDLARQEALLARGWRGIAPGQEPGSLHLLAPAQDPRP